MTKIVPHKIPREVDLRQQYMQWIRSYGIIPPKVVRRFKQEVETVRKMNPIYETIR